MADRFGLVFTVLDTAAPKALRRSHGLEANPFAVFPRTIIGLPWLRTPRVQRLLDEVLTPNTRHPAGGRRGEPLAAPGGAAAVWAVHPPRGQADGAPVHVPEAVAQHRAVDLLAQRAVQPSWWSGLILSGSRPCALQSMAHDPGWLRQGPDELMTHLVEVGRSVRAQLRRRVRSSAEAAPWGDPAVRLARRR